MDKHFVPQGYYLMRSTSFFQTNAILLSCKVEWSGKVSNMERDIDLQRLWCAAKRPASLLSTDKNPFWYSRIMSQNKCSDYPANCIVFNFMITIKDGNYLFISRMKQPLSYRLFHYLLRIILKQPSLLHLTSYLYILLISLGQAAVSSGLRKHCETSTKICEISHQRLLKVQVSSTEIFGYSCNRWISHKDMLKGD